MFSSLESLLDCAARNGRKIKVKTSYLCDCSNRVDEYTIPPEMAEIKKVLWGPMIPGRDPETISICHNCGEVISSSFVTVTLNGHPELGAVRVYKGDKPFYVDKG